VARAPWACGRAAWMIALSPRIFGARASTPNRMSGLSLSRAGS
jgi:hypothetical protein